MNIPKMANDGLMRASAWNALVDQVRSQRILPSVNILPTSSSFGTALVAKAGASTLRPAASRHPWDLYIEADPTSTSDDPPLKVKLIPGMINGVLCTNWEDEFPIGKDETKYGVAKISTDGINITDVEWNLTASLPTPQQAQVFSLSSTIFSVFGVVHKGASLNFTRTAGGGGLGHSLLSRVWMVKPVNAAAGELAYEFYYYLA
jgi:hypothetical protein